MTNPVYTQLSDADDELLSAYIDDELAATERAALEARLAREPALRAALDDLRATVALLGELPQLVPPRSFALDPAAHRSRWQVWSALLWRGSALCAVLLALSVTLDLVGGNGALPMNSASAPVGSGGGQPPMMAAAAPTSAPAAAATAAPAAAAATAAPAAAAAMAPAATSAPAAAAAAPQAPAAPAASATGAAAAPTADAAAASAESTAANSAAASPAQSLQSADATRKLDPSAADSSSALTQTRVVTPSGSSSPGTAALDSQPVRPAAPQPPARRVSPLRAVQLALGALVLLLAGAALWVARRRA